MKNKGFTLFELLVTIAIIGILSAVVAGSFADAQKKGRDARRIGDMDGLQKAAEMYFALEGSYPLNTTTPWTVGTKTILEVFPSDPKTALPYGCSTFADTGYCCCATMENVTKGNSAAACVFDGTKTHYCVKNQQ
jgi:prepilin-type N-terminal cleavage/methylation domain-containing protein